jgi:hypothetical protein
VRKARTDSVRRALRDEISDEACVVAVDDPAARRGVENLE